MTPTQEMYRTRVLKPPRVLEGLDAWVDQWRGAWRRRTSCADSLRSCADQAITLESEFRSKSDGALGEELSRLRKAYRRCSAKGSIALGMLPEVLAALRESARRTLNLHAFPVQLLGAAALHRGFLIEMATGEGKTLTAGLAAVLAAWQGQPCHVITVNDYLVERDAQWLSPFFHFCGVSVGTVLGSMGSPERQSGYAAEVTYVTAKELLADFLRDRLQLGPLISAHSRLVRSLTHSPLAPHLGAVQRGLHTAIVDEADSVLIDEAVTPLIISAPRPNAAMDLATQQAHRIAQTLLPQEDYQTNRQYREILFTEMGRTKVESQAQSLGGLWLRKERREELVREALVAREFFLRDRHYVVHDQRIVIVDESTGRPMPNRTWHQLLHQAIEAKEGLPLSPPPETVARMSFQRFFRCYPRLSGMSGTVMEGSRELWHVYQLPAFAIPTHRPCVRVMWPDRFFVTEQEKFAAMIEDVARIHATGRPVLIGTRSVAASERLSELLKEKSLDHAVLNAQRIRDEAQIIALAGLRGRITIATNMAGRGTDIRLGPDVAELGGLHVMGSERHESHRVDRQLAGRSGRQGDPGSVQFYLSFEDELFRTYTPEVIRRRMMGLGARRSLWTRWALQGAQGKAGRQARRQRAVVLKTDHWLEESLSFASSRGVGGMHG